MNINVNYYNEIYEDFITRQPYYEEHVAKVIPKNTNSIRVILKDGSKVDYNIRTHTCRNVPDFYDSCKDDVTDEYCRDIFATNLVELMKMNGFNQPELSKRTGLSIATISKYMKKQATPTITNLEKIAYALNCSRDDLME